MSQVSRADFFKFITEQKDKVIWGFEACGACNFLARKVAEHGHDSKIMPAASIKSFLGIDKSDKIDAMGIFRALITPTIREIKPRSVGNQMLLWLFTAREQLNKQMVQTINVAHAIFVSDCGATSGTRGRSVFSYSGPGSALTGIKNISVMFTD